MGGLVKLKKILCVFLTFAMIIGGAIFVYAQDSNLVVTKMFQTSSNYDLGIDAQNVRLAWQLDSTQRGAKQTAYNVQVRNSQNIVWDSGWVVSDVQTGIKAQNLQPETVYYAKVNVKDENGIESGFGSEMSFETAPHNVNGNWIGIGSKILRKTFTLSQSKLNIERARAYIGSTSIVETRLNGQKVGDLVLAPNKPVPDVCAYYNTYDILSYLQDGQNTAGLMISDAYPMGNKVNGMIKIYYKDGLTQIISTDDTWRGNSATPVTKEGFFAGEDYNPNIMTDWDKNSFIEDSAWKNATISDGAVWTNSGKLIVPSDGGTYYTKQSFSGDYTIEVRAEVTQNVFALLFGSGSPYPAMWQLSVIDANIFKPHMPGSWGTLSRITDSRIQLNTMLTMKIDITGTTVKTYLNGDLLDTRQFAAGQTEGPLGIRSAFNEAFNIDYIKVTQNGSVIWEDSFDTLDTTKWNFPSSIDINPAITATKIIKEIQPVSITTSAPDSTKPYVSNSKLIVPANSGTYYTNQSFSGDYTIEVRAEVKQNVFALLFGSGSPNPAMWQLNVIESNIFKPHMPATWASFRITDSRIQYNTMLTMKVEITGTTVKTYLGGDLIDTRQFSAGQTTGPLGIRSTVNEAFNIDYIKVTQNGSIIWEDNFDTIDTAKWNIPVQTSTYVVDFGKNMSGYVKLKALGVKNSVITVKYAELLNSDGTINPNTTFHRPTCNYTLSGANDVFEPKFFYTGFRYIQVAGYSGSLTADKITACFISDDLDITGNFTSSNDRLNSAFSMYEQSQLSNMVNNYTDCPQREKDGWTGDAAVIKEASAMLLNDYTSAEAYMKNLYIDIFPNGQPFVRVPKPISSTQGSGEFGFIDPTWTSAYFIFPYETYLQTGDKYYLEMAYDSLVKVFEFYKTLDTNNDYIIENNTFGDWVGYDQQSGKLNVGYLSATNVYNQGMLLSKMAQIIGKDHSALDVYMQNMYNAIQTKYNKTTYMGTDTETQNSMALDFDLVPEAQKQTIVNSLIKNVVNNNKTLMTGVLGTKAIYDALSQANEHKLILDTTINPSKNSIGYMIDKGATTLWEYWDSVGNTFQKNNPPADSLPGAWDSQNHVMLGGGLGTWVFKGLGGIEQTEAAYKEITFRAGIESGLGFVNSEIDTIIGKAVSNWTNSNGQFTWNISVPANSTAKIIIPFEQVTTITESGADIFEKNTSGLIYSGTENGMYVYTAGSGDYSFNVSYEAPTPITQKDFALPVLTQKFANNNLDSGWVWRGDTQQNYILNNSFSKISPDNFAGFSSSQSFGSGTKITSKMQVTYAGTAWVSQFIGVRAEGDKIHTESQKGLWIGFRNESKLYVGTAYSELSAVNIPFDFNTERDVEIKDLGNTIEVYAYNNGEKILLTKVIVGSSNYDIYDGSGSLVAQKSVALNLTGTVSFAAFGSVSIVKDIGIGNICGVSLYKDNIEKGKLLQGAMQLKVNGNSNKDFVLALAVFDENKCVSVHTVMYALEDIEKTIEFSVPNSNCTAKIMIIDKLSSLKPIDHAVEY